MSIYTGSTEIQSIYSGSTEVQSVYSGSDLVWQNKILTALQTASSIIENEGSSGSWSFNPSSPSKASDGDLNSYAEFTGTSLNNTTNGSLKIYFPPISAKEVLRVRLLCKGRGPSDSLTFRVDIFEANDGTTRPDTANVFRFFSSGTTSAGSTHTLDTGLVSTDYLDAPGSGYQVDFPVSNFIGSSSSVIDWWAGGAGFFVLMSDFNGGGIGGRIYELQLQVEYKPA